MDLAIVTALTLILFELLVSILLVLQCITTDLIDFGSTLSLMRHKMFSTRSPPIPRLIVLYRKMKSLHTVGQRLSPATIESPITTTEA